MPNILAIMPGMRKELGGCEIYRISMPFHYLEKKHPQWHTQYAFYQDLWSQSLQDPYFWQKLAFQNDLFVVPRMYFKNDQALKTFEELAFTLHQLDKKLIYEVDDDMTNQDRHVIDGDAMACMKLCDAVTVTTPYLKAMMQEYTDAPVYVLPNMISPETFLEPTPGIFPDKVVVGLSGSTTHERDWEVLKDVLPKVVQDPKVHLLLTGYHPEYLKNLPNTTYLPGYSYEKYVQIVQKSDIIISSINNEPFNLGKSPIKAIEGMAARRMVTGKPAGAAVIASNHPVYQLAIEHEKTGLLVDHTSSSWQEGLDRLIYDDKLRHQLQFQGHSWVLKHHDISKTASLWMNAYSAVLRKKIKIPA